MKTPADWLHLLNWRPPTLSMVEAIQTDARADLEDATLKSAYAQQSLIHEVDALKQQKAELRGTIEDLKQVNRFVNAENAKMRKILDSLRHSIYCDWTPNLPKCPACRWENLKKEPKS